MLSLVRLYLHHVYFLNCPVKLRAFLSYLSALRHSCQTSDDLCHLLHVSAEWSQQDALPLTKVQPYADRTKKQDIVD